MPYLSAEWRFLLYLLGTQRWRLLGAMLLTLLGGVAELAPYWVFFQVMDALLSPSALSTTWLLTQCAYLALAMLLKYGGYALAYFLSHHAAYAILVHARQHLLQRLAWASLPWLQQQHSGQLKQAMLQDVERIESFVAHHTVEGIAAVFGPGCVLVFLFWLDWRLALATLASAPLALLASGMLMRNTGKSYAQYVSRLAGLDAATIEYVRNMPVMKVFRLDASRFQWLNEQLDAYYTLIRQMTPRMIAAWSGFAALLNANLLCVLPLGLYWYAQGQVSLSALLLTIMLGAGMLRPLFKINHLNSELREVLAGVHGLLPVLHAPQHPQHVDHETLLLTPSIEFDQVSFSYPRAPVLHDVSFKLAPASLTVLLGPSGAGKSATAQLLAGLLQPDSGSIRLGARVLADISEAQRTRLIGLATQEPFLFQGSLIDNLRLGNPLASDADVALAIKVAQAEALLESLPQGYQTHLHEHGVRLSGGERQRLAVARVLLADTPILVLDEATSFADNMTQKAFYQALRQHYPEKTVLVITHRAYGVEWADQILVMENGRVVDRGVHAALLARNHFYQHLWTHTTTSQHWHLGASAPEGVA